MDRTEVVDLLNELVHLDIDAVRAYGQAIDNVKDPTARQTLVGFREDHERHVTDLSAMVRNYGGEPAERPDLKGVFLEGMTALRSAMGEGPALRAMRDNERFTNRHYVKALETPGLPDEVRNLIARNREDERRHLAWIEARVGQKTPA
ncbi:MAG: DUF2383 domain-containing protein [Pseudomonadota bacterium]|nr:DUF2383 domain-containing protein [Pseudomonadota bacterium]